MKKLLFCLFICFYTVITYAQAPEGFKYQAVVRDAANAILSNQAVSLRMTIQQGAIGGTTVYAETFSTNTNAYGLVNLEIGNGTVTSGTFASIDWANGPYFIETAVDVTGGTNYVVMGTSQLLSVPYALYAKTSGSSIPGPQGPQGIQGPAGNDGAQGPSGTDGLSAYEVAVVNGFVGTEAEWLASLEGAQGPQGMQGLAGNDGAQGPQGIQGPSGLLTSGSTAGNTPYWDGTDWVVNSSNIHNNGGSVGIGTDTPSVASKLEVSSNTQGFLPPRMTSVQRDAISNPVDGLMIFNISSGCPNYYFDGVWHEWCGTNTAPLATLVGLVCGSSTFAGNLLMSVPVLNSSVTVPYTGGNGGAYGAQLIPSTGVNGLFAELNAGSVAVGSGDITFSIIGTPENSGTATFQISLGGQSCSFSVNVGLPAPTIVSSTPASPSNSSTTPTLEIFGPANKTIDIYDNPSGTGVPVTTVTTDIFGGAMATVSVLPNSSTTFVAIASDGLGNVSALSNTFTYVHNSIPPATPTIQSVSPMSPSNSSTTPTLLVSGDPGTLIQIFKSGSCTGPVVATATVGGGGTVSIPVSVTSNSSTIFTANATDAAGNLSACSTTFTYLHDIVAPSSPVITSSTPSSPSNSSTTPNINFTAEPFTTVRLYANGSCAGAMNGSVTTTSGGFGSIMASVSANSTTIFSVNAIDPAGNLSPCSVGFTYVHDAVPPAAPVIVSSSPASPGISTNPTLNITGAAGATLRVYNNSSGTGSPVATTTMSGAGTAAVSVTVASGSMTNFSATVTDAAGNVSAVSAPFNYTHTP